MNMTQKQSSKNKGGTEKMSELKKYRLTDKTIQYDGRTLYQIEALKKFYTPNGVVKA